MVRRMEGEELQRYALCVYYAAQYPEDQRMKVWLQYVVYVSEYEINFIYLNNYIILI